MRASLHGADGPGEAFRFPSLVADWGLDYFAAEARHAQRALASLDEGRARTSGGTGPGTADPPA